MQSIARLSAVSSITSTRKRPTSRSALIIATMVLVWGFGCGGRESRTNESGRSGASGAESGLDASTVDEVTEIDAADSGADCVAVGGQCLIGSAACAGQTAAQFSCGGITPAGFYCCLPSDSGSSDDVEPDAVGAAQAFVMVTMGPSAAFPGQCTKAYTYTPDQKVLEVGQPGTSSSQPVRVTSGTGPLAGAQIGCSVHPQGGSYTVNLQITQDTDLAGSGSMSLTVMGVVDPTAGATMDVLGEVSTNDGAEYISRTCSVTYSTPAAGASPPSPPVAAGRIWAHLSCPAAQATIVGMGPAICDAEADFIFENCGQ